MIATNANLAVSVEDFRRALKRHLERSSYANVSFRENLNPEHNIRVDDYTTSYEAEFFPCDLTHAYLKVQVSEDGRCGIGIETRYRVAERIGMSLLIRPAAFAAGKELMTLYPEELITFVGIIGSGNFFVTASRGLIGLGRTKILMLREYMQELNCRRPYDLTWDWISLVEIPPKNSWRFKILAYKPW